MPSPQRLRSFKAILEFGDVQVHGDVKARPTDPVKHQAEGWPGRGATLFTPMLALSLLTEVRLEAELIDLCVGSRLSRRSVVQSFTSLIFSRNIASSARMSRCRFPMNTRSQND